jgi:MerR family mercuric resistance operon transcriptional regulator
MKFMTISALAKLAGIGVETVRFYQRLGLLETPERPSGQQNAGRIRRYGDEHLRTLRFIRAAKAAGFTLDEIGELIALDSTHERARARHMAHARIAALDEKISELSAARKALKHLAAECAAGSEGPCPILEAFDHIHA